MQIHRDFGQAQEQFVNRRQDYFYPETLSLLLAVALLMPMLVLMPGTSSTRCRQEGGSSFLGRTPTSEHLPSRIQQLAWGWGRKF